MFDAAPPETAGVRETPDGRAPAGPADHPTDVVAALDAANADVARSQRAFLRLVATAFALEIWRDEGARDLAHWLSMRYGISGWKARRWIDAAEALERLPAVDGAFTGGEPSLDKTVELTRFATSDDEGSLVRWAADVSVATVRRRGDRARVLTADEVADDERSRRLEWWWLEDGRRLSLTGEFAAAQGGRRGERDPPGGRSVAERLLCDARVQVVTEDRAGDVASASGPRREPSAWMVRQLRYRDRGCTSRDAGRTPSRRPTTSDGGPGAAGPTSGTSSSSARSITGSCTSTAGRSGANAPRSRGSRATASATAQDREGRRRREVSADVR